MISTVLACTSGRGTSVREAIEGIYRSVAADSAMPKGTVYYMKNGDVRSTVREWGFDSAVDKLKSLGVKAVVESGALPVEHSDVIGITAGVSDFNWAASKSRILPGAICEHLTSFGGMMTEGAGQTPLTEFLRNGAAGASGTVHEPFAIQAKFPTPFIHSFYAQGCTLGEAFYLSLSGPYQLLLVGDALCKPWGRRLVVKSDLSVGAKLKGTVKITPTATSPDRIAPAVFELYLDGKRALMVKNGGVFEWDTRSAPDGAHEVTIVANAGDAVASQGRLTIPIEIRNSDETMTVSSPGGSERPWDQPIEITVNQPGATEILVMASVRIMARLKGDNGKLSIDPRTLGQGPVRLMTVATREGAGPKQIIGKPLDFTIVPPPPLPAQKLPAGGVFVDEIEVRAGTRAPAGVKRADGDWLAKAGVGNGERFSVEAWFDAPEGGVYQFQINGTAEIAALSVDGVRQTQPRGKTWWFVPVNLAKGLHRMNISAIATGPPVLDVRFGGPGTLKLDGSRFKRLSKE